MPHPALAVGSVHHVGDAVAMIVAETSQAARDAAEAVMVDYDVLPSVTDLAVAMEPGQPLVWPQVANNVAFVWETGDKARTEELFGQAAHVTKIDVVNNRVIVNSLEGAGGCGVLRCSGREVYADDEQPGWVGHQGDAGQGRV